jgi:hypothetical protein
VKKAEIIVFVMFCVLVLSYTCLSKPVRHGDGHEYSLISQAFVSHMSPEIRVSDVVERERQIQSYRSRGYVREVFKRIEKTILEGSPAEHGIFRAQNSSYYGFHFWMYPGYVAAVEFLTGLFGANPLAGFQIANALLFILVAWYCLLFSDWPLDRKITSFGAFFFGGSLFYLKWTHPEVLISSCLFLAFLALFNRSFRIASLFLGLAGTQVVTLWALFAIFPVYLYFYCRVEFMQRMLALIKQPVFMVCALLPASSFVFYYCNFKKLSLIGSGYTNLDLISLSHFYSFWFDLDQGTFVGAPWLVIIVIAFFAGVKKVSSDCKRDLFISSLGAFLVCLPLLCHTSVNAGQSVFQRYALYGVTPIVAWAGYYLSGVIKRKSLMVLLFLFALVYSFLLQGANAKEDYFEHKPWTKFVLNYLPEYYNPEPGIFYTRSSGSTEWSMNSRGIIVHKDNHGYIRKILLRVDNARESLADVCDGRLVDDRGNVVDYKKVSHQAYGWGYINGRMSCSGRSGAGLVQHDP